MSNVSKCFFCTNKKDYDAKFGYFGCAYSGQECKDYSMFEPKVKPKVITNADRIRGMTDEELVEFLAPYNSGCPKEHGSVMTCHDKGCYKCWEDWLKKEVEE